MASSTEDSKLLRKGGMGRINESNSPFRVDKVTGEKVGEIETEKRYREISARLFKNFLLDSFDYLKDIQSPDKNYFQIPANTLSTDEIETMLAMLDGFNLLVLGSTDYDLFIAIKSNKFFKFNLALLTSAYGKDIEEDVFRDILSMLGQLREFLIVEYLNSLNTPITEHIVHNLGFLIDEAPDGFRVSIQLENWAGKEDLDNNVESFSQENLEDIVGSINTLKTPEEKAKKVTSVLNSMLPLAKTIDFIRSNSMKKLVSEQGQTIEQEVRKVPFMHFDIKPNNIFARKLLNSNTGEEYYNLILGDFGLATLPDMKDDSGAGTPGYVAPELLNSYVSADLTKADVHSFAVTLFEILVGNFPNTRTYPLDGIPIPKTPNKFLTYDDQANEIVEAETNLVRTISDIQMLLNRGVATHDNIDNIFNVLAKGMSTNPKYRYSSCTEMMEDLFYEIRKPSSVALAS